MSKKLIRLTTYKKALTVQFSEISIFFKTSELSDIPAC